jgi:C-terminal processing protease CtpA/Prc
MLLLPTIKLLSEKTVLLTIPTFGGEYREPLVALIAKHRKELATRTNWIIDVRDNDGGDDTTYYPLLPWLMPDETEDVGVEWLATPANIEGHENVCGIVEPGDKECEKYQAKAVRRMQSAVPGSYVPQDDGPAVQYSRVETLQPHRPERVAVLVDLRCGSSCEEFLLTVRQSFNVKLLGRHSRGSLDYSNLCPHKLPSGERMLWYATSRSDRLPDLPVDVAGIPPDIYLPKPTNDDARKNEVVRVQRWLEGGSLAPINAD